MHVLLAFLWDLARDPGVLLYVKAGIPWEGASSIPWADNVSLRMIEASSALAADFQRIML
jgi:hypothetical protein